MQNLTNTINWNVEEKEIFLSSGDQVNGFKALIRTDNNKTIHVHKNSYNPFSNEKLMETTHKIAELCGGEVMGFNEFNDGKKILGFVKPSENIQKIGIHPIKDFIVIGNSHDGTSGIFLGTSTELIRCTNKFSKIVKDNIIRHTKNYDVKMEDMVMAYNIYQEDKKLMYEKFEQMSKIEVDSKLIESVKNRLFNIENNEEISTAKAKKLELFDESLEGEMRDLGQNMFGLFQAITQYSTHKITQRSYSEGNVFGTSAEFNKRAIKILESELEFAL